MTAISLLELADLNLTPGNRVDVLNRLLNTLATDKLIGRIYCIVICGGLTADESDASYEAAKQFLIDLQPVLHHPREEWKRRVLVVPGRSAYAAGLENFRKFQDSFFSAVAAPFDQNRAMVRYLHDFTLLGATYVNGDCEKDAESRFTELQRQLGEELGAWHGLDYIKQGPIIMVTAESPLLDPHLRLKRWQSQARRPFQMVDLYLFGPGQVSFLPSEPFTFAPASVGLGPARAKAWTSLHLNHIEFRRPAMLRGSATEPSHLRFDLKINSYSIDPTGPTRWSYSYYGARPVTAPHADERFLHKHFIDQLGKQLQRSFFVTVLGYGDVWRDIVAKALYPRTDFAGNPVDIKVISPVQVYPTGRPEGWRIQKFSIAGELEEFKCHSGRHIDGGAARIKIAIVMDEAFSGCEHNRRETYEAIRREFSKVCDKNFRIVYLVNAWDVPPGAGAPHNTSTLPLDPLDHDSFETLMDLFSLYVPLDRDLITRLSGGYVSFVKLLFEAISEHFQSWDKEREPSRDACLELVEHALEVSPKLAKEAQRFFDFMRQQPAGIDIGNFLFSRFKKEGRLRDWISQSMEFSRADLEKAGINHADVTALAKGIIHDAGDRFELLERIPFLVRKVQHMEAPKVFISYAQPDHDKAKELEAALGKVGIESWVYTRASKVRSPLDQQIMEKLKDSAAVVVVWTAEALKSRYVLREAREAAKPNKPRLINWFVNVTPPSIREGDYSSNGASNPDQRVLAEFKDFLGKEHLQEIVRLLVEELTPFQIDMDASLRAGKVSRS